MDDVGTFHRYARGYDLLMPGADADVLDAALGLAERDVERVIDLAGGTGRASRALTSHPAWHSIEPIVLDAARGMVGRARDHGLAVVRGDATRLPVADRAVDAVLIVDALHHLPDRDAAIHEAARILAPGGVLVVQEFDPTTLRGRALAIIEHLVGFDSAFDSVPVLVDRLRRAGLEPTVVRDGFAYVAAGRK